MVTFGTLFDTILQYWYIVFAALAVAVVVFAFWFIKRKAKAKLREKKHEVCCLLLDGDVRRIVTVPSAEIKDFASMRFRVLDKNPVYFIRPYKPAPIPVPEPPPEPEPDKALAEITTMKAKLKTLHPLCKEARALRAQIKTLTDGNGHKPQSELAATKPVEIAAPDFKYEPWQPNPIPELSKEIAKTSILKSYAQATPKYLFRLIHWEEQAKVARVKNSGINPTIKLGAIVVVLVLAVITIFLFGVILMDKA